MGEGFLVALELPQAVTGVDVEQPFIREFLQRGAAGVQRSFRLSAVEECVGEINPGVCVIGMIVDDGFLLLNAILALTEPATHEETLALSAVEYFRVNAEKYVHGFIVAGGRLLDAMVHHVLMDYAVAAPVTCGGLVGVQELFKFFRSSIMFGRVAPFPNG